MLMLGKGKDLSKQKSNVTLSKQREELRTLSPKASSKNITSILLNLLNEYSIMTLWNIS